MTVFRRYWLLQIPGWIILGVLLSLANRWFELPISFALAIALAWLIKDVIFYPILRNAYQTRNEEPADVLVGARAIAQEELRPSGYVKLRGELWRANAIGVDAEERIPVGATVVVEAVRGLTLLVRRSQP